MKRYLNLLLVCILGWTWNMPGAEEEKVVVPENLPWAILDRAKEKVYPILKTWMEVPYTATSDGEKLKAHLAGLELNEGSASLSEEERAKLNEALLNLCLAFSSGKEEDYFAFRTPKGPKWKISSPYLTMLYKKLKEEEKEINYENLSSALIEYTLAGRKSYENFWKGVCLDAPTLEKHLGKERSIYLPKYGITIRKLREKIPRPPVTAVPTCSIAPCRFCTISLTRSNNDVPITDAEKSAANTLSSTILLPSHQHTHPPYPGDKTHFAGHFSPDYRPISPSGRQPATPTQDYVPFADTLSHPTTPFKSLNNIPPVSRLPPHKKSVLSTTGKDASLFQ